MRALLLAGLVAWLAGAGGQQRHPYTLWADGDRQQMEPPANLRQYRDKSAQINVVHIMIIVCCPRPSL